MLSIEERRAASHVNFAPQDRHVDNVSKDAFRSQIFDAGIRIDFEEGDPFYLVAGNPFELFISDCLSRSEIDLE